MAISITQKTVPTAAKVMIAGTSVTAGEIETATGSLATFFTVFGQAIKTKNIEAGVEISVEEAVTLAADLGFGEPFTGIAKAILPLVFGEFNTIAAEPLIAIDDGRGGYVTSDWMHDARHQIDSDGNFTN